MKKFTLILCFFFATHSAYTADKKTYNEIYPLKFTWLTKKTLVQVAGKPEVFNAIESSLEDFKKKYQLSCRVETKTHNKQGLMVFQLRGDLLSGQFSQKKDLEKALISYILPEYFIEKAEIECSWADGCLHSVIINKKLFRTNLCNFKHFLEEIGAANKDSSSEIQLHIEESILLVFPANKASEKEKIERQITNYLWKAYENDNRTSL